MKKTLKDYRRDRGLTALGICKATAGLIGEMRYYMIERGRYKPRPEERTALAVLLGVPEGKLFPDGGN